VFSKSNEQRAEQQAQQAYVQQAVEMGRLQPPLEVTERNWGDWKGKKQSGAHTHRVSGETPGERLVGNEAAAERIPF
jgi:hypothetical protein